MKLEINSNILWIDGIPSFLFSRNGEKDPITPTGWMYYCQHREEIDKWIEKKNLDTDSKKTSYVKPQVLDKPSWPRHIGAVV